ncbi:MAG: SMC-Scp complex subunit ScpB [Sphingobacteriales bacterium]|nr:SMC-Scp complex subunit ScpB [Sphingobacteriales bacterium]OJY90363.1 MAG: SMC-Scp complex subunit ScpB [Sphingobacteriales bacterium 44-15]
MEISQIILHIEALVFASEKPLTAIELVELVNNALGFIEDRATLEQVEAAIDGIREKYATEFYPFEIRQSGGGWQFLTKGAYHKTIAQLNGDKFIKRLSAAAMETLAIIAYKQPITKGEIESIRGVNCDYVVQKLLEKELVVISGRNEELPGKPLVYATSKSFMDYFGINSPDDLPKIREVLADQVVQPTLVNASHFEVEEESNLVVGENGELLQQTTITLENVGENASSPEEVEDQTTSDPTEEEHPTAEAPGSSGVEDAENDGSSAEEESDKESDL